MHLRLIISIHALREEGDAAANETELVAVIFLSTPSARRATCRAQQRRRESGISIHALREEGDGKPAALSEGSLIFLSTPSARRATRTGLENPQG